MHEFKLVKFYRLKILMGHQIGDTFSIWVTDRQTDIQTFRCTDINMVTLVHTRAMQAFYVKENFSRKFIIVLHKLVTYLILWHVCGPMMNC